MENISNFIFVPSYFHIPVVFLQVGLGEEPLEVPDWSARITWLQFLWIDLHKLTCKYK